MLSSSLPEIIDLNGLDFYDQHLSRFHLWVPYLTINETGEISNSPPELVVLKDRLKLINQALRCTNATCTTKLCKQLENLIRSHIPNCTSGIMCYEQACNSTRQLLEHQRNCQNVRCVLCSDFKSHSDDHAYSQLTTATTSKSAHYSPYMNFFNQPDFSCPSRWPLVNDQQPVNLKISGAYSLQPKTSSQVLTPTSILTQYESFPQIKMPNVTHSISSMPNPEPARTCKKCKNHGIKQDIKGHRSLCPFTHCECLKCYTVTTRSKRLHQLMQGGLGESSTFVRPPPLKIVRIESNLNHIEPPPRPPKLKLQESNNSTDIVNENGIIWKKFDAYISETALVYAGKDADESAVYVGRVYCGSNLLPAKLSIKNQIFTTSCDGIEHTFNDGEMLIESSYSWKKVDDGVVPKNAVFGGLMSVGDGENLLIGKTNHEESMLVGRVSVNGVLSASFKGQELNFKCFEILVKDDGGKCSESIAPLHQCTLCLEDARIVGIFMDCGHACLCIDCIPIINAKRNKNGKVNCLICTRECYMARKIHFA